MKVRALKPFISTRHGNIETGQIIPDYPAGLADTHILHGLVERYEDEPVQGVTDQNNVPLASGADKESSSAPAGQASTSTTRKKSKKKKS